MSRALVEYVTQWLIDYPEELQISEIEGESGTTVIELSVNPEDTGKIIGRNGRIIRALRVLARAAAQRDGRSIAVEVVD